MQDNRIRFEGYEYFGKLLYISTEALEWEIKSVAWGSPVQKHDNSEMFYVSGVKTEIKAYFLRNTERKFCAVLMAVS